MMRVKDRYGFEGSVEFAVRELMRPMSDGQVERLEERVDHLEKLLSRYLGGTITEVEDLNYIAGFDQFEEVK